MSLIDILAIIIFVVFAIVVLVLLFGLGYLYVIDRKQKQHPVLRNYPLLGRARYILEKSGPELRQYLFNNDREGKPISRDDYQHIVKKSKYRKDTLGFGSERNFEESGFFISNSMFPKLNEELNIDPNSKTLTNRYILLKDPLFTQRKEKIETDESSTYLLDEKDTVIIGKQTRSPFHVRGLIGMSGMSYGALGERAITALSEGLGMAKGTWMNTGEGGLSEYHLKGDVDIIMQIGPGKFGVRDAEGHFDWEELKKKSMIPQVKAFEVKLAQGAKTRGGHVDGNKVTEEIASIRMVEPYKSINSPNRFKEFPDFKSLFDFMTDVRQVSGIPVGMKVVIGNESEAEDLAKAINEYGDGPDFITIDGSEGGTGASYPELANSVGLPIKSALPLLNKALKDYGVRHKVKIIASGKLFSPDRAAIALALGADLINIARGFMITVGCIQALQCHSNTCPVGVATTDPDLQRALVVDEKKHRTANYVISMRKGLFRVAAATGLDSPVHLNENHVVYKNEQGKTFTLEDIYGPVAKVEG